MTRAHINLFMWGYQEHFTIQIRSLAKELFKAIGLDSEVQVILFGVRRPEAKVVHAACLEPENGVWPLTLLDGIADEVDAIYRDHPGHLIFYTHAETSRDQPENLRRSSVGQAVQRRLEAYDQENATVSFVGPVAAVEGYHVATVIQIPRATFEAYPELPGVNWQRESYTFGFLRCCLNQVLEVGFEELLTPEPGRSRGWKDSGAPELARRAAKALLYHAALRVNPKTSGDLLALLNQVAALRYEGRDGGGGVELVSSDAKAEFDLALAAPAPWREARWCRKLLEMASPDAPIIATDQTILGIGRRLAAGEDDPRFRVDFRGHHDWELSTGSQVLLRVQAGEPRLPQAVVPPGRFFETLARLFPEMTPEVQSLMADVLVRQAGRSHGSQVIIAADAEEEAKRLSPQSMMISPQRVSEAMLVSASRIDGGILVDPNGVCHAIGVVLDGPAHPSCSPARGARYNSALRYVAASNAARLAIVVSDDQTVDVLPLHPPKVSAKLIATAIEQLEQSTTDNYHSPRNYLSQHAFYLNGAQCERYNTAVERIENEPLEVGEIRLESARLSPHPAFDESYLF